MNGCPGFRPLIQASVEGDTRPADALRVARHVRDCTACRILLARESRLKRMLDDLDEPIEVDEGFFRSVMASLPERTPPPTTLAEPAARRRRGLRLAGLGAVAALSGGMAAKVLPSLRLDLTAPAVPRFSPEDTDGWFSLFGSAAQWVRVTAQSLAWTGTPETFGPHAIGLMSVELAMLIAAIGLAISGALMLASRAGSRVS